MERRIGLTYDLRSEYLAMGLTEEEVAEFDSAEAIEALDSALTALGYRVERIGSVRALCRQLVAGASWDLVFNVAEGLGGRCREGQVPSLLEVFGIPYTFSDPLVCALTLDKALAKRQVAAAGLNTPASLSVAKLTDVNLAGLAFPLFVKPNAEGTGRGITARSRVDSKDELYETAATLLAKMSGPILVEEFLPGREFTVGILGTGAAAHILGTMEIHVLAAAARGIYSFETKENWENMIRYAPVPDEPLKDAVEALALAAYSVLECRDTGRVDIRLDRNGEPSFMEVNPLPGLRPHHSDLPMIAAQEGMSYVDLIDAIVCSAFARAGGGPQS